MASIKISVINASTVLGDSEVNAAVPALQSQVHRDFYPAWGIDADLTFVPSNKTPTAGAWWLVILDDSDEAGALGYHDMTSEGLPLGKVFAKSDLEFGYKWTVTASHELLEMLADPAINLTAFVEKDATATGVLYAYEVCDACEADNFGYEIDGVTVSDFIFPAWFENFRREDSTQFDQRSQIHKPFALLPGGYIGVFDISAGSGWHLLTPERKPVAYERRPRLGSRRERRRTPRDQWQRSSPGQRLAGVASLPARPRPVPITTVSGGTVIGSSAAESSERTMRIVDQLRAVLPLPGNDPLYNRVSAIVAAEIAGPELGKRAA